MGTKLARLKKLVSEASDTVSPWAKKVGEILDGVEGTQSEFMEWGEDRPGEVSVSCELEDTETYADALRAAGYKLESESGDKDYGRIVVFKT